MNLKKSKLKETIIRVLREEEEKKMSPSDLKVLNIIDKINNGDIEIDTVERLFGSLESFFFF